MIRLTTSEYDTLQEYTEAVVYEYLNDEETEFDNTAVGWVAILNRFTENNDWHNRMTRLMEVFNVSSPSELAEIYNSYKDEISELLVANHIRVIYTSQTANPVYDTKIGWEWDDEDPLILAENNKGLVARYALLTTLDKLFTALIARRFVPRFEYDD